MGHHILVCGPLHRLRCRDGPLPAAAGAGGGGRQGQGTPAGRAAARRRWVPDMPGDALDTGPQGDYPYRPRNPDESLYTQRMPTGLRHQRRPRTAKWCWWTWSRRCPTAARFRRPGWDPNVPYSPSTRREPQRRGPYRKRMVLSMQVDEAVLKKLNLSDAAKAVTTGHLDRFPPLIMDTCLGGLGSPLVPYVVSGFSAGAVVHTETLTMPRRGFSPRPVTIMSPAVRTLYAAIIAKLAEPLSANRTSEAWDKHEKFGDPVEGDPFSAEYLVEFDIASCYEYVDHARLREELLLRTMDVRHTEQVIALLGEMYPSARGLPQLSTSSDVLADTYLEVLERALLRTNSEVSRFADDFKVEADDWGEATKVIEDAAEQARALGLILAADKTHIWKSSTLIARRKDSEEFLDKYFAAAKTALTEIDWLFGGYGGGAVEIPPGDEEALREAFRQVFQDWFMAQPADMPKHSQYLPAALSALPGHEVRVPHEWLVELVFRQPLRLEAVSNYILARTDQAENWVSLKKLADMPRQSPWAKLWLLHVAQAQARLDVQGAKDFDDWALRQLDDRHEVVRAQVAWYLASRTSFSDERRLAELYREASTLTRPALAAACGGARMSPSSGLVKAVQGDSKLTAAGYKYGTEQVDPE